MTSVDERVTVSVILPSTCSRLDYLGEAIASLEAQTYRNFEVVLLVDGQMDDEKAVRDLLGILSRPYRIVFSKKRRGISRSLNILARLANGEFLARMDDDDICNPQRFSVQVDKMVNGDLDVVGSSVELIDQDGAPTGKVLRGLNFNRRASFYKLLFGDVFFHPSVMIRRTWWKENRYCPEWKYGEDRELWIRSYGYSRFANIDCALLRYRIKRQGHAAYVNAERNKRVLLRKYRSTLGLSFFPLEIFTLIRLLRARTLNFLGASR